MGQLNTVVVNKNSTGVYRVLINKLESRVIGILARQVVEFGVWVGYRSSIVWPVERVFFNQFHLLLYNLVSIGVVITV